jgi:hypothetical protein
MSVENVQKLLAFLRRRLHFSFGVAIFWSLQAGLTSSALAQMPFLPSTTTVIRSGISSDDASTDAWSSRPIEPSADPIVRKTSLLPPSQRFDHHAAFHRGNKVVSREVTSTWKVVVDNTPALAETTNHANKNSTQDLGSSQTAHHGDSMVYTLFSLHDWFRVTFPSRVTVDRSPDKGGLFGSDGPSLADARPVGSESTASPTPLLVIQFGDYDLPLTLQALSELDNRR